MDRDAVVETLSLAFEDDPLMAWVFEDRESRRARLGRWWGWIVDHRPAHAEVLDTPDGSSAAVWYGPDPVPALGAPSMAEVLVELLGSEVGRRKLEGLAVVPAAHPAGRHWYLGAVGTRPGAQGRGSAQRVVRPVLERCDRGGLPAYLESSNPRNRSFYERLGFRALGPIAIPGGPGLMAMWRDPS